MGPEVPFVNGDAIAARLNPDAADAAAREAGRIALGRMESYAAERRDFAFETSLGDRPTRAASQGGAKAFDKECDDRAEAGAG